MDYALIEQAARSAGIEPGTRFVKETANFVDRLLEVNKSFNLTAITDEPSIATRHLQDSWIPARFIAEGASLIDVGAGAGFPGLLLWIARRDLSLTLVDASAKRVAFLEDVIARLLRCGCATDASRGVLSQAEAVAAASAREDTPSRRRSRSVSWTPSERAVLSPACDAPFLPERETLASPPEDSGLPRTVHARAEDLGRDPLYRERYDVAIARAVAALPVLVEFCLPLVRPGGRFIAMKGRDDEAKAAERAIDLMGGRLEKIHRYRLPDTDAPRALVVIRKRESTPSTFPRRTAVIRRKPL